MLARLLGAWVLASPEALGQSHADPACLLLLLELVSSTPSHSVGRLAVTQPHTQEGAAFLQVLQCKNSYTGTQSLPCSCGVDYSCLFAERGIK